MIEFLQSVMNYLLANYALYLVVTMGVIVSFIIAFLSLVKKPIKKLTSRITNEKLRKLVNKMFILMAFGVSCGAWFILNAISNYYFPIETLNIILTGALSVVIYSLGDGVITESKAKQLFDTITDFVNSKDEGEKGEKQNAVAEYLKKVKK